ncbi:hypothetical protein [Rhizobium rosettiformans]|jgi:hypothetical protein|uniref:hypothetical protein n=1 Tax=Rhizobium rosettiformans TaxID=1368430 RepID=UPI002855B92E|nr:hypothetical protein [Rhizobium rosettiformans]MDR7031047.1 hypothetical protein [Rhizobium rosettiformans]MDR7066951.1 hypothetical protein [Rhizobium rosettiformans]
MSSSDAVLSRAASTLADALTHDEVSTISDAALQELLSQAVRVFSAKRQVEGARSVRFPINAG